MKIKWILSHCDLDLWPKVTNFNRVWASAVSNNLATTASKFVHPFRWNFVHKQHTHTHRDFNMWHWPGSHYNIFQILNLKYKNQCDLDGRWRSQAMVKGHKQLANSHASQTITLTDIIPGTMVQNIKRQ